MRIAEAFCRGLVASVYGLFAVVMISLGVAFFLSPVILISLAIDKHWAWGIGLFPFLVIAGAVFGDD